MIFHGRAYANEVTFLNIVVVLSIKSNLQTLQVYKSQILQTLVPFGWLFLIISEP